jgi:hypothetical protein
MFEISDEPQPKLRKFQLLLFSAFASDSFRSLLPIKLSLQGFGNSCVLAMAGWGDCKCRRVGDGFPNRAATAAPGRVPRLGLRAGRGCCFVNGFAKIKSSIL